VISWFLKICFPKFNLCRYATAWVAAEVKAGAVIAGGAPGFALAAEGPWDEAAGVVEGAGCGACAIDHRGSAYPAPPQTTRNGSVTIAFKSSSASAAATASAAAAVTARGECRLSGAGGGAGAPSAAAVHTHDWRACGGGGATAATYDGLHDGAYTFSVRCASDGSAAAVPATVRFDVDTTPPGAFVRSDPSLSAAAAAAYTPSDPVRLGEADELRVHFSSRNDVLAPGVVFECRLSVPAASPHQSAAATAAGNGRWLTNCVTPYVYRNPPEGSYLFEVRGGDAAGNWDVVGAAGSASAGTFCTELAVTARQSSECHQGSERRVSVEVHWGGVQTRIVAAAVKANLTSGEARFSIVACGGDTGVSCADSLLSGVADDISFKCGISSNGVPYAWQPCGADGGEVVYDGLADGLYWFTARAFGDETPAVARFVIDRMRPVVSVTSAPRAVTGGGDVPGVFTFTVRSRAGGGGGGVTGVTSDAAAGVTAECCTLASPTNASSSCAWSSCSSPHPLPRGLADGDYSFSVRAVSASGVAGDPTPAVAFRVDSVPPVVAVNSVTAVNALGMVCVTFTAVDDLSACDDAGGGHVNKSSDGDGDGRGCGVSCKAAGEHDWKPCASPTCYAPPVPADSTSTSAPAPAPAAPAAAAAAAGPPPAGALGWCSAPTLTLEVLAVDAAGNRAEASVQVPCGGGGAGGSGGWSPFDGLPVSPQVAAGIVGSVGLVFVAAVLFRCCRGRWRGRGGGDDANFPSASSFIPPSSTSSHANPLYNGGANGGGRSRGLLPPPPLRAVVRARAGKTPSRQRLLLDMEGPRSPMSPASPRSSSRRDDREIELPAVISEMEEDVDSQVDTAAEAYLTAFNSGNFEGTERVNGRV
jgi:hypothetical protein